MSIKFYLDTSKGARRMTRMGSNGHITRHDTGRTYKGLGVKDLKRRLAYWEGRQEAVVWMTRETVGPAKAKATKLIKSGEKLLATLRGEIEQRGPVKLAA